MISIVDLPFFFPKREPTSTASATYPMDGIASGLGCIPHRSELSQYGVSFAYFSNKESANVTNK